MKKTILVPMANGAEDIELVTIIDIFKRAQAVNANLEIICASIHDTLDVVMDTGLVVKAEVLLDNVDLSSIDAVALHGGFGGMTNLKANSKIMQLIKTLHDQGKIVGAICSSPIILAEAGVLGDTYTCYPGCESNISSTHIDKPVVITDNIITSAGPSTAMAFAFAILRELGFGEECEGVEEGMLYSKYGPQI